MKQHYLTTLLFLLICNFGISQNKDSISSYPSNGLIKPSILSTHPFGIFFSRLQGNFKIHAVQKSTLNISLESGNVWGTPIKTYIPNKVSDRNIARQHEWHQTQYYFNEEALDAESFELQIDGVIKGFRANISFNIGKQHELNIAVRSFLLTTGELPFSFLTGDDFIESFHKNIAGGDDPFDRGVFGLNKAKIEYTDRNGNHLELDSDDFIFGGIETSYYYYPESLINANKTFYMNFGAHLGTNLSKYNSSMDLGLTANAVKVHKLNDKNYFQFGLVFGLLRKNIVEFKSNNIEFGTNDFIANLESLIEFNFISKRGIKHSFGADFYIQTSLNKKDEYEYIIPIRNPIAHDAWGHGVTNLYRRNDYWTLLYSFTKKVTTTIYLQQDFTVNNNPDIQTGVSVTFRI